MKRYTVKVNGIAYEVEVEETGGSVAAAPSTAVPPAAAAAPAPAMPTPAAARAAAVAPPHAAPSHAVPPPAAARAPSAPAGATPINAPMPGTILRIAAGVGERVKRGQAVVVLEAMKMENEIVSPVDGTVASVNVAQGANVNAGDLLASIN